MFQGTDDGTTTFRADSIFTPATSHLLHDGQDVPRGGPSPTAPTSCAVPLDSSAYSLPSADPVQWGLSQTHHGRHGERVSAPRVPLSPRSSTNEPIDGGSHSTVSGSLRSSPGRTMTSNHTHSGATRGPQPPLTLPDGIAAASAGEGRGPTTSVIITVPSGAEVRELDVCTTPAHEQRVISPQTTHKSPKAKRSYGNLRPICGGRFLVNKDSWHAIVVAVIIFIVVVLFLVGVPSAHEWWTFSIVIVFALASIACVLLCVSLDPGILEPRPVEQEPHKLNVLTKVTNKSGEPFEVSCAVCRTCHIRRPPRSTHCQFCDVCVEEFDHHCGVLGSCVGKRTFRFFTGFFMTTTILCLYVAIRSIVFLVHFDMMNKSTPHDHFRIAAAIISVILPAFSLFMVMPCAGVYLRFSLLNWTEKEHLRVSQTTGCCEANAPFDEGCARNLIKRLCGPLGERHVQSEYWV